MGEFLHEQLPEPTSYFEAEGLKLVGKGKWRTTSCNFHGGSDSLRVNVATGAWVCMAGCGARGGDVLAYHMAAHGFDFVSAAKALGAWTDDGTVFRNSRPKPLPASLAIQVLGFESTLTAVAAGNIANGVMLSSDDRARLTVSAQRINAITRWYL
jgi:hypothetical protein